MSDKAPCAVEGVAADDGWTLSGWQDEPSVPESARAASAKLSKYKPATKPEPLPGQYNSSKALSGNSSSRSLASAGSQRSTASQSAFSSTSSSSSTSGPAANKRRPRIRCSPQTAAAGGPGTTDAQFNTRSLCKGSRHLKQQQQQLTASCGEEDLAGDAVTGEHYRPPSGQDSATSHGTLTAAASSAAAVAVGSYTCECAIDQDSIQCGADNEEPCQQLQHSTKGNIIDMTDSQGIQQRQEEQQQQQLQQDSSGDALMQGLLNRLACSATSTTTSTTVSSSSSGKALRPTLSLNSNRPPSSSASQHALFTAASDPVRMCSSNVSLPATRQQQQQGCSSSSGSSRSGSASSVADDCNNTTCSQQVMLPSHKQQHQQQGHEQPLVARQSSIPSGVLHLGSTVKRCQSINNDTGAASVVEEGPAAADGAGVAGAQSQERQQQEQDTLPVIGFQNSSGQLQTALNSSACHNSNKGAAECSSLHQASAVDAHTRQAMESCICPSKLQQHHGAAVAVVMDSSKHQTLDSRQNSSSNTGILSSEVLTGLSLQTSGMSNASIVANSSSSMGLHGGQLQTPGLAAKAQMVLTRNLAAAAQTPRTRLMQAAAARRNPAAAAAAGGSGSFGLGVLTAAAPSAVGLSITSCATGARRTAGSSSSTCRSRPSSGARARSSTSMETAVDEGKYICQNSKAWGRFASSCAAIATGAVSSSSSSKVCRAETCGRSRPSSAGMLGCGAVVGLRAATAAAMDGQQVLHKQLSVEGLLKTNSSTRQLTSGGDTDAGGFRVHASCGQEAADGTAAALKAAGNSTGKINLIVSSAVTGCSVGSSSRSTGCNSSLVGADSRDRRAAAAMAASATLLQDFKLTGSKAVGRWSDVHATGVIG